MVEENALSRLPSTVYRTSPSTSYHLPSTDNRLPTTSDRHCTASPRCRANSRERAPALWLGHFVLRHHLAATGIRSLGIAAYSTLRETSSASARKRLIHMVAFSSSCAAFC